MSLWLHCKIDRQTKGVYLTHEFVYHNKIYMLKTLHLCFSGALAHEYVCLCVEAL